MARRFTQQAGGQINPVFAQSGQAIQGQLGDVQQLYNTLIQGLQAQQATETQGIVESAARRGVGRSALAGDVGGVLGETAGLEATKLGAQRAGDIAGIRQRLGELGAERVGATEDLAGTLQSRNLQEQQAQLDADRAQREFELGSAEAERAFEVDRIAAERAEAEAAASGGGGGGSITVREGLAAVNSLWQPGRDGFVNPKQWNQLREAWIAEGLSGSTFDSQFSHLVNPAHQRRARDDLTRYKGVSLTGKKRR